MARGLLGLVVFAGFGGGPGEPRGTEETALFLLIGRLSATRFCAVRGGVVTPRGRGSRGSSNRCLWLSGFFVFPADRVGSLSVARAAAFPFASPALDPALWALTSILSLRRESPPRPPARRP